MADRSELDAFVDEVIESARTLADLTAPAAEAWASGAIAEWLAIGGPPGSLGARIESLDPFAGGLIGWIEGRIPEPPASGADWLDDLVPIDAIGATELAGAGNERALIIEYEAASGIRHDLSVAFAGTIIVDIGIGPTGLVDAANDSPDHRFVTTVLDPAVALAEIGDALTSLDSNVVAGLGAGARLNLPLVIRRFGHSDQLEHLVGRGEAEVRATTEDRDPDADRYAAQVVASATVVPEGEPEPHAVGDARTSFAHRLDAGDLDAVAVLTVAGLDRASWDGSALVRVVGAYLAPVDLSPHEPDERAPIAELEPADWVGVILGLLRSDGSDALDGEACVRFINRCPEITTTIPKGDAPRLAWAFDRVLYAWELTGVLDDTGRVTEAGRWLLPRAASIVWGGRGGELG